MAQARYSTECGEKSMKKNHQIDIEQYNFAFIKETHFISSSLKRSTGKKNINLFEVWIWKLNFMLAPANQVEKNLKGL